MCFWLLVLVFVWCCVWFGFACVLFPSSFCVSFPFNDDLGTPPTWRPYSWKNISRPNWQILAKRGTVTATSQQYFKQGYPPTAQPNERPYQIAHARTLRPETWAHCVGWFAADPDYINKTEAFIQVRKRRAARTNRMCAKHSAPSDDESSSSSSSYPTSHRSRSHSRGQSRHRFGLAGVAKDGLCSQVKPSTACMKPTASPPWPR